MKKNESSLKVKYVCIWTHKLTHKCTHLNITHFKYNEVDLSNRFFNHFLMDTLADRAFQELVMHTDGRELKNKQMMAGEGDR